MEREEGGGDREKVKIKLAHNLLLVYSLPPHPIWGQGIPSSCNIPHVESQLHIPGKDVGHHVPPGPTKLIISIESQSCQIIDAVHQYPYEVIATANPEPIHMDVV